jgi:hypothetical protein
MTNPSTFYFIGKWPVLEWRLAGSGQSLLAKCRHRSFARRGKKHIL